MNEPAKPAAREGVQMAVTALNRGGTVVPGEIGGVLKQMMANMQNINNNTPPIAGLPPVFAKVGAMLGLSENTMSKLGELFTKMSEGMKGSQMVASNNGGGLLANLRNAMGIEPPAAKSDLIVKGPNNVAPFTPGADAPEGPAAATPTTPRQNMAINMTSPSGPTMG